MTAHRYYRPPLAGLLAGAPDLRDGLCQPGNSTLPPGSWDCDASPAAAVAAIAECGRCPVLGRCRAWLDGLPRRDRPSGVVAGRRIAYLWYARDDDDVDLRSASTAVTAAPATATATARPPAARKYTSAKKARNLAYHAAHRAEILARKLAYHAARADEVNAARRAARAADPEAVRAAQRAYYEQNRDQVNERRRAKRRTETPPQ